MFDKFEFCYQGHQHEGKLTTELNKLGAQGWELVSVVFDTTRWKFIAFLKRKKEP